MDNGKNKNTKKKYKINKHYKKSVRKSWEDTIIYNNENIIKKIKQEYDLNNISIVAKGPTAKFIESKKLENGKNTVSIGINQGILLTSYDFLFIIDFVNLFGCEHILYKVKYIFCPDYPRNAKIFKRKYKNISDVIDENPDLPSLKQDGYIYNFIDPPCHITGKKKMRCKYPVATYKNVKKYVEKFNFKGQIFVYQRKQDDEIRIIKKKKNLIKYRIPTNKVKSTSQVAIRLFNSIFQPKNIHTYGFNNGSGYHEIFRYLDYSLSSKYNTYMLFEVAMKRKNDRDRRSIKKSNEPFFKIIQPDSEGIKYDSLGIDIIKH